MIGDRLHGLDRASRRGLTGDQFVDLAIKNNMLIIPSVFSERTTHSRICFTVPDERLKQGADLLCKLAAGTPVTG